MIDANTLTDILWTAFELADNCCADRELDIIDTGGNYESFRMEQVARNALADIAEARTIRTDEQLDALPFLSVVRELPQSTIAGQPDYGAIWERRGAAWHLIAGSTWRPGSGVKPALPALLLYEPSPE